jgi:hypothetical protein
MSYLKVIRQRLGFNGKTMILGSDFYAFRIEIQNGLIATAVPKLQLECLCPARQAKQLMPQANAKYGLLSNQFADSTNSILERLGIAGAIGQEDSVWILVKYILSRRSAGQDRYAIATLT